MSRYIDADALLSKAQFVVRMNDYGEYYVTVEEINKMPTVDAVPVVRCRECKWYDANENYYDAYCYMNNICVEEEFYCAGGERRTDGNET